MKIDNRNILIGAGVVVVGYLLWKKNQSKVTLKSIDPREAECIKQGRSWDSVEKFCGMSNRGGNAMPQNPNFELGLKVGKLPDEFVIKSNDSATRYYQVRGSFGSTTVYMQGFKTDGSIGASTPMKISNSEFLKAYDEFLKQPK
jgi:hypothetical protein